MSRLTPSERETLQWMAEGGIATRVWTGRDTVWLIDNRPSSRVIKQLIRKGLVWTHYPMGPGSAGINDEGTAALS